MPRALLRLRPDGHAEWLDPDRPGDAPRAGLPPAAPGLSLLLLAPAEDVLLLEAARPPGRGAQLAQAVPFAVEDQLAGPIEAQHVAWREAPGAPARLQLAVARREAVQAWLARVAASGLPADGAWSEAALLAPGTLLVEPGRALARLADGRALAGEVDEVMALLQALGIGHGALSLRLADGAEAPAGWQGGAARAAGPALAALAEGLPGAGPDLLQGAFAPVARGAGARQAWRVAALLAAAVGVLAFAALLLERQGYASMVEAQQAEAEALVRRVAPDARAGLGFAEASAVLAQAAGQGGASADGALGLLARAAPALAEDPSLALQAVEYRSGQLDLVVVGPDVAALDALRGRLAAATGRAELTAATPGTRGVEGRLRLGAPR